MKDSAPDQQESTDRKIIEDIIQLKRISLGEGAAACQVCGSSFHEGDAVTVYVFRPAEEVMYQVGYIVCGDKRHEHPREFTLGVRELLVAGRVGWCTDAATQSSWPVLLAPEVLAVSAAATKSVRTIPSDEDVSADVAVRSERSEAQRASVPLSVGEARRRAAQAEDETAPGLNWGGHR
jgi:hypothetical protein